ncbi:MAG: hypothetical protein HYR85_20690 [Planctomycetes bacterium]|nr:hypothetical protein [Planctomycetota bacterium]MBI3846133.1 hypothetical protein [Planctomycetota bacterium]
MNLAHRSALLALVVFSVANSPAVAHDVQGILDFSNELPLLRTTGGTGIPNGNAGFDGVGYPIDPRDLQDSATGRARVFHEHFGAGQGPFSGFDGTVVFCVFKGNSPASCTPQGPILPPPQVTYTNTAGDYSVTIDFARVTTNAVGADDVGTIGGDDWVYAYVLINDEGDGNPRGSDPIEASFVTFSSALRQISADIPMAQGSRGMTIGSGGDVEPTIGGSDTTNPDSVRFAVGTGLQAQFGRAAGGDGCIPDVRDRLAPPLDCNSGPFACVSNVIFMTSPFGPGVCTMTQLGGSSALAAANVTLGPLTYPNVDCVGLRVNNISRPGLGVDVGDTIQIVVDVANPMPATPPPYLGSTIPGGTSREALRLAITTSGGHISGLGSAQQVCLETDARTATRIFTGTFDGPGPALVGVTLTSENPYAPGVASPFDSASPGYVDRFPVNVERLAGDPSTDCETIVPSPDDCRGGNVNAGAGSVVDVLFVNQSPGVGTERRLDVSPTAPFQILMSAPPSNPNGPAPFVMWVWRGQPSATTVQALPFGVGFSCMPTPLDRFTSPQPFLVANTIGASNRLGVNNWSRPLRPAPSLLMNSSIGIRASGTFFLQGIILDSAALNHEAAVTNGILVVSR